MAETWENLGVPGEGNWTAGQGLLTELRVAAGYQPLQMLICLSVCLFLYLTNRCGHIADELEVSCVYTPLMFLKLLIMNWWSMGVFKAPSNL